jgi:tetratricopeptide (TPR) repeat protein
VGIYLGMTGLIAAALLATLSRGGVAAFLVAGTIVQVIGRRHRGKLSSAMWMLLLGFLFAGFLFLNTAGVDRWIREPGTLQARFQYWKTALALWNDFPVFGAGAGAVKDVFPLVDDAAGGHWVRYVHNEYINWMVEFGLAGLLLAVFAFHRFFRWIWPGFEANHHYRETYLGCGLWGLGAVLLHSGVDYPLRQPATAIVFMMLAGVLAGLEMESRASAAAGGGRSGDFADEKSDSEIFERYKSGRLQGPAEFPGHMSEMKESPLPPAAAGRPRRRAWTAAAVVLLALAGAWSAGGLVRTARVGCLWKFDRWGLAMAHIPGSGVLDTTQMRSPRWMVPWMPENNIKDNSEALRRWWNGLTEEQRAHFRKHIELAIRTLRDIRSIDPADADADRFLAEMLKFDWDVKWRSGVRQDFPEEFEGLLLAARGKEPMDVNVHLLLSRYHSRPGSRREADRDYERVMLLAPRYGTHHLHAGVYFMRRWTEFQRRGSREQGDDPDELRGKAEKALTRAFHLDPNLLVITPVFTRDFLHWLDDTGWGRERLFDWMPREEHAFNFLGEVFQRTDPPDWELASRAYASAEAIARDAGRPWSVSPFELGKVRLRTGKIEEAFQVFDRYVEGSMQKRGARIDEVAGYLLAWDARLTAEYLERAMKDYPELYEVRWNLGLAYGKLDQNKKALDTLRPLAQRSDKTELYEQMVRLMVLSGQGDRVLGELNSAISRNQTQPGLRILRARWYRDNKRFDAAVRELSNITLPLKDSDSAALINEWNRILEIRKIPAAYEALARLHVTRNQKDQARTVLRAGLKEFPADKEIRELLRELEAEQ